MGSSSCRPDQVFFNIYLSILERKEDDGKEREREKRRLTVYQPTT